MGLAFSSATLLALLAALLAAFVFVFRKGKRLKSVGAFILAVGAFVAIHAVRVEVDPQYATTIQMQSDERKQAREAIDWKPTVVSETTHSEEGVRIPRSVPGDKGSYFLIEAKKEGDIIKTLHKRVGVGYTGWTRCEINCKSGKMRDIGYSEEGPKAIKTDPTKWYDLVQGSSKSDLFNFVCKR